MGEGMLQDMVALTALVCGTSMVCLHLVADGGLRPVAVVGMSARDAALVASLDPARRSATEIVAVADAAADDRLASHALVDAPRGVRFFAAVALVGEDGSQLGLLTILDETPRRADEVPLDRLHVAAGYLACQIGVLRRQRELTDEVVELRATAAQDAANEAERARRLSLSESWSRATFEQAPVGLAELRLDGSIVRANKALGDMLEVSSEELVGQYLISFAVPEEGMAAADRLRATAEGEDTGDALRHIVTARGNHRWVTGGGSRIEHPDGRTAGILSYMIDSTSEHVSRLRLMDSSARFAALVEYNSDAIIVLGHPGGVVEYASPSVHAILGLHPSSALGIRARDFLHPDDFKRTIALIATLRGHDGKVVTFECRLRHADGSWRYAEVTASNRISDPAVGGIVVNLRDITDRVEAASHLAHQALHDALTGLPNRALILDRLDHAVARARRSGRPCAVLFIDLDRFKQINDTLGHRAGDEVLKVTADRLRDEVRHGDSVARLGGDEFVILAEDIEDPATARDIAERIRLAVSVPIALAERTVTIGCSIGIAVSSRHAPETLIQEADLALYRAKDSGRNRWEIYDQAMRLQALRGLEVEDLLRSALTDDLLTLHYQPIIDLTTGRAVATEALARITRPDGVIVPPGDFISVAEESGLIVPVGAAVLQLACAQQSRWRRDAAHGHVAVNVSARQLTSDGFVDHVTDTLARNDLTPDSLCIEITESTLIDVGSSAQQRLHDLKAAGVTIALDDFGTGWASLGYLRRFPIDIIKIDRSFVAGLGADDEDAELVKAVVGLGRALDLTTVAEGVETERQDRLLDEFGCNQAQGYFYGRPAPADATAGA